MRGPCTSCHRLSRIGAFPTPFPFWIPPERARNCTSALPLGFGAANARTVTAATQRGNIDPQSAAGSVQTLEKATLHFSLSPALLGHGVNRQSRSGLASILAGHGAAADARAVDPTGPRGTRPFPRLSDSIVTIRRMRHSRFYNKASASSVSYAYIWTLVPKLGCHACRSIMRRQSSGCRDPCKSLAVFGEG